MSTLFTDGTRAALALRHIPNNDAAAILAMELAAALDRSQTEWKALMQDRRDLWERIGQAVELLQKSEGPFYEAMKLLNPQVGTPEVPVDGKTALAVNGCVRLEWNYLGTGKWIDCYIVKVDGETLVRYTAKGHIVLAPYNLNLIRLKQ